MSRRFHPPHPRPALASALLAATLAAAGIAQDGAGTTRQETTEGGDALRAQLQEQALEIEALRRRLEADGGELALELEDLRLEVELLTEDLDAAGPGPPPAAANAASAFNPRITVFADALGRIDSRPVVLSEDDEEERIDDSFHLRGVEIDLRAAVDPYADAVVILAAESEAPGELEAGVEEGYLILKRLPWLETAPAGLKLKVGRFRSGFGFTNRIHAHDLPWATRPTSASTFLGEEGLVQHGVAGELFLPSLSENDTLEATVEILGGGEIAVDEEAASSDYATVGRLNWYTELGDEADLTLGLSTYQGGTGADLYGADVTWRWLPIAGRGRRSLVVGGELFRGALTTDDGEEDPTGGYAYAQLQLNRNLYAGVRYDRTDSLEGAGLGTETVGGYLSYYTSEFLRLRLGTEHQSGESDEVEPLDTIFLELTFLFGSHPAEPYWVNR
ncbi:MAG: hypothetical protein QGI46_00815 [Planctomycetota bacterium]|jgi:hypothetical protein|nr:hypothetical protein [Planctomycetota bacterium]